MRGCAFQFASTNANIAELDPERQCKFICSTQGLLRDIATYCPLGTDTVENVHAQNQSKLFAWRGSARGEASAMETSVLSALGVEHMTLKIGVLGETVPSVHQVSQMQRRIGRTKHANRPVAIRAHRMVAASQDKPRRLCPWNLFHRERLKEAGAGGRLSKDEFKEVSKKAGIEWRHLPQEERERYQVQTCFEQTCCDELESRPLQSANERAWTTLYLYLYLYPV